MIDVAQLVETLQMMTQDCAVGVYDQATGMKYDMIGAAQMQRMEDIPTFEPFVVLTIDSAQVPGKPIHEWHPVHAQAKHNVLKAMEGLDADAVNAAIADLGQRLADGTYMEGNADNESGSDIHGKE